MVSIVTNSCKLTSTTVRVNEQFAVKKARGEKKNICSQKGPGEKKYLY